MTFTYRTRKIFQGKRTLSTLNAPLFSQPQAPNDSLDFQLKSVYDHHKDFFWRKNQILYQKETVSEDQRWVFVVLCWQWHFRSLIQPCSFLISHVNLQETGKLKAGHAGKGTRERHQSVGRSAEALHLQHQVKHR